ncbi:MAG TPA: ATP-binding cassette domain-containing protein, partial [Clostridium sp.]
MIDIQNLNKSYKDKNSTVEALRNISIHVNKGDIFGIIGYSGAGKSTLIRCINLLERPDSGKVIINGADITKLSEKNLRKPRQKIGMIFQHFNLLQYSTIYQNVAFPLLYTGINKKDIKKKVYELLELVGLTDKALSYPSQLSGGQKQRVAIARALANDPQILLSDEATSALDPQTTDSILNLLGKLNKKLNLTIVIITHQMAVIKEVCNRVAVIDNGEIVEQGTSIEVFIKPKHPTTRKFVDSIF